MMCGYKCTVAIYRCVCVFVQVYITECVGVKWVGFSSMCFGVSSAAGSLFIGKILSHIPRFVVMLLNWLLMLSLMVFLLVWDREPNLAVVFVIPILWGFCDSIWNTVTTSKSLISIYLYTMFRYHIANISNRIFTSFAVKHFKYCIGVEYPS